jgi:hypothetical protein
MKLYPIYRIALCAALALAAQNVSAKELVTELSGQSSTQTREFEVRAPWIVDWLVSGDPGQYDVAEVSLINAETGAFEGVVLKSKTAGNGVRMFKQGGRYYFRVNASMMKWNLKVYQLTEKEAEQYKPKSNSVIEQ